MAQIRKKTAYPDYRPYLRRAREQGIALSWDRYERMLPQDGFARLGLSCFDCLLGPCRLDPFSRQEERTVCGFGGDDLVYRSIIRLMGAEAEGGDHFESLAGNAALLCASESSAGGAIEAGPGVLDENRMNICVQDASAELLKKLSAEGIKVSTIGRPVPGYDSAASLSDAEFVLMTGLVDAYAAGSKGSVLPRGAAASFHTALIENTGDAGAIIAAGREAFKKRDSGKIRPDKSRTTINAVPLTGALSAAGKSKIAVIGGGGNIKQTVDELLVSLVRVFSEGGVFCIVCGDAAAAYAKYDRGEYRLAYCCDEAAALLSSEEGRRIKPPVFLPALRNGCGIAGAIALGAAGFPVYTAAELPLGNGELGKKLLSLVSYAEPENYLKTARSVFGL